MIETKTDPARDRTGKRRSVGDQGRAAAAYDLIAVAEGRHANPPLPDLQMVVQGDLTAILAAAPRPSPRPVQSLQQHLADAETHHDRQQACLHLAPMLPVRFDTPLTREAAARCLTANQPFLDQLLARYAGLAQMQVSVRWDRTGAPTHFGAHTSTAAHLSTQIGAEIGRIATAVLPQTLTPDLLFCGMVLIPLQDLGALSRALARIKALWPQGLTLQQSRPDPVGAFATLDLTPVHSREIEQALVSFGLSSLADLAQVPSLRRRKLLLASGFDDGALRVEIQDQAEILSAASRLTDPHKGFALCRIWSDGRLHSATRQRAVA